MPSVRFRGGLEVGDPLGVVLAFLAAYPIVDARGSMRSASFDESDLRLANRGGARISAAEIATILERRAPIERALHAIDLEASLADPAASIPWAPLTRLFDAFADIHGVGFSKTTKALHPKRPALIPILDSVVQTYLATEGSSTPSTESFALRATSLVRAYKRDLHRNRSTLRKLQRELERRDHRLTEVRILDLLIWSAYAPAVTRAGRPSSPSSGSARPAPG